MIISGNYKGCNAFIHYSDDREVTHATIVAHNKEYMTIAVRGAFKKAENNEFVSVLIVVDDNVHEYRGKLRRSPVDLTSAEIALFKGKIMEQRSAKRYPINISAAVEFLITDHGKLQLQREAKVTLVNLSTTGALIKTMPDSFSINSVLEIKLNVNAEITTMHGQVVRVRNIDASSTEYGCKLVSAF